MNLWSPNCRNKRLVREKSRDAIIFSFAALRSIFLLFCIRHWIILGKENWNPILEILHRKDNNHKDVQE